MGFTKRGVDLDRLLCRVSDLWKPFIGRQIRYHVAFSETDISHCVIRVLFNRLMKILDGFVRGWPGAFVPVLTTLQVELISLGILGLVLYDLGFLSAGKPRSQLLRNVASNIALQRRQVTHLAS